MELTNAINHLKESLADPTHKWGCEECKQEHEQLLEWLEDYKRLRSESSWIPCSERMPEYPCIVADANGNTPRVPDGIAVFRDVKGNTMAFDRKIVFEYKEQFCSKRGSFPLLCEENRITHWMPLPQSPKGESK